MKCKAAKISWCCDFVCYLYYNISIGMLDNFVKYIRFVMYLQKLLHIKLLALSNFTLFMTFFQIYDLWFDSLMGLTWIHIIIFFNPTETKMNSKIKRNYLDYFYALYFLKINLYGVSIWQVNIIYITGSKFRKKFRMKQTFPNYLTLCCS